MWLLLLHSSVMKLDALYLIVLPLYCYVCSYVNLEKYFAKLHKYEYNVLQQCKEQSLNTCTPSTACTSSQTLHLTKNDAAPNLVQSLHYVRTNQNYPMDGSSRSRQEVTKGMSIVYF